MRACDPLLAAALAAGEIGFSADIYDVKLQSGAFLYWSGYARNLTWNGNTYYSQNPFLTRSKLSVTNTMELPELEVYVDANTELPYNGGLDLSSQIHNRLLDGATITLNRLLMRTPTDTSLGTILLFTGLVAQVDIDGIRTTVKAKGANNSLGLYAPKRVYQVGCSNTFCDPNCTLLSPSFTHAYTVGASPSIVFVPWTSPPADPSLYLNGTLVITSGAASGQSRAIDHADSSGVYLVYPLYNRPSPGDTFTAQEGCNKTFTLCGNRTNTQNNLAFPYIPPAATGI